VTSLGGALVFCYLFLVIRAYSAVLYHEQFRDTVALIERGYGSAKGIDSITHSLRQAIRYDGNNADYAFALGDYLFGYYVNRNEEDRRELRTAGLAEAESWVEQAVMRDPANPWYYYELGRINFYQADCKASVDRRFDDDAFWESCPTARYFLAALENAPNEYFLRRVAGGWLYHFDRELGLWVMRHIIPKATDVKADGIDQHIAQFLYDIQLDYESDNWLYHSSADSAEESATCEGIRILHRSTDGAEIELGNDDGTEEWRVFLTSENARVKKVICLPENVDAYQNAALKIMMNHAGRAGFVTRIALDDQIIKTYHHDLPRQRQWHEIPIEKQLFQEKSRVNIYLRVTNASYHSGNYLQVWGDQDTPTIHSSVNDHRTEDLSRDRGTQTGEYMIRLVLRKE
jgi:hypothetical protein